MINCICKCLLVLACIAVTSLPYYAFFIIIYLSLRRLSPDRDISKRFYNPISSEKEEKTLRNMGAISNYIVKPTYVFCIVFIVFIASFLILYNLNGAIYNYILSAEALRLQKYIIESLLTVILAAIGSVAIFSSLDKQYYLFFSTKDVVRSLKVKDDVIAIILSYFLCVVSTGVYYIGYYVVDNSIISEILKAFSFCGSIFFSLIVLMRLLKLFYSVITFLFSDKVENRLLDSLYYSIHDKNSKKVYIPNEMAIQRNLEYLLSKFKAQLSIDNEKIFFISFLREYNNLTKKVKQKNLSKTIFYAIISNIGLEAFLYTHVESIKSDLLSFKLFLFSLIPIIILNIGACSILYKTKLRDVFIHVQMWTWGFLIEKDDEKYYCSTVNNKITNKGYDDYIKSLYCIVRLYKDVLLSDKKWAEYCLNEIIKYVNDNKRDYILYSLCLYLYCSKYGKQKAKLEQFKEYIKNNNVNWDLLQINTAALIHDIDRYDPSDDVKRFIASIKNSNYIVKIQKAKKL